MSKIPDHATRVFKGIIFDVYQWEQRLFDGNTVTFEGLKRPDTVVVIAMDGDRVFYAKQEQPGKKPFVSLFGGRSEEGELPLDAAKRELQEETGLVSDEWREIRCFSAPGKIEWSVHYFVAKNCRRISEQHLDGGEKITVSQTSLDEFLSDILGQAEFSEHELKQEVFSAFNGVAAEKLKADILADAH